jgi:hypothetical protein
MNELLMQLLGYGGGGGGNYGNPPSGPYGEPPGSYGATGNISYGNIQNPNFPTGSATNWMGGGGGGGGGSGEPPGSYFTGGTPLQLGNMPAGDNKGGPKTSQPTPANPAGVPPANRPNPPVAWHGLTNDAGASYGWAPGKGTPQQAGWNPWVKGTGFTRVKGL